MRRLLKVIEVVGIEYKVFVWDDFKEMNQNCASIDKQWDCFNTSKPREIGVLGYCLYDQKEIHIYIGRDYSEVELQDTLRHEICHVFLFEIGNSNYDNEDFVSKISRWIPHIMKSYNMGEKELLNARNKIK